MTNFSQLHDLKLTHRYLRWLESEAKEIEDGGWPDQTGFFQ